MANVDARFVERLREQLDALPTRSTVTSYELVARLAPAISAARARGQDLDAIVTLLEAMGVRIKPATVRNYLSRVRRRASLQVPSASVFVERLAVDLHSPPLECGPCARRFSACEPRLPT